MCTLFKPLTLNWCILIPVTSCLHSFFDDHNFDPYSSSWKFSYFFVLLVVSTVDGDCGFPNISHDHAAYVATLISDNHQEFRRLYPDKASFQNTILCYTWEVVESVSLSK